MVVVLVVVLVMLVLVLVVLLLLLLVLLLVVLVKMKVNSWWWWWGGGGDGPPTISPIEPRERLANTPPQVFKHVALKAILAQLLILSGWSSTGPLPDYVPYAAGVKSTCGERSRWDERSRSAERSRAGRDVSRGGARGSRLSLDELERCMRVRDEVQLPRHIRQTAVALSPLYKRLRPSTPPSTAPTPADWRGGAKRATTASPTSMYEEVVQHLNVMGVHVVDQPGPCVPYVLMLCDGVFDEVIACTPDPDSRSAELWPQSALAPPRRSPRAYSQSYPRPPVPGQLRILQPRGTFDDANATT